MTSRSPIVVAVHRLLLRTSGTPLARVWALGYRALARAWGAYLTRGERDPSTYVRASFSGVDPVPGLSDIDLAVVLAPDPAGRGWARERTSGRWERLRLALPATDLMLDYPRVYEEADLEDLAGATALTYGLGAGRAGYFGEHAAPHAIRLLERPGLYGSTADWRLLSGPDRRPPEPPRDPQTRRIAAWLELVYWWQWTFPVCIDPTGPRTAHLCVKLVAEPARIWLWLAHGERTASRADALCRALRRLPEEEDALRLAIELQRSLPEFPAPPLQDAVAALVRLSTRIAALIAAELREEGVTEVRLVAGDPSDLILPHGRWQPRESLAGGRDTRLLPLCDWRALAVPRLVDESFALLPDDPHDPGVLGAAAGEGPGPYPALRADRLLILPAAERSRTGLRAVQCAATDPVSFALIAGAEVARFPVVCGWSAEDTASRAVAEHAAFLRGSLPREEAGMLDGGGLALARLFSAARAASFLGSVEDGDPELTLTTTATARRLADRSPASRGVVEDALDRYRDFATRRVSPPARIVTAMRSLVAGLPAYRA
ncbi:MAG: hypothetical protein M3155_03630 [Actinomycetota bacterium]|nr:hypothetical protein [Actinomycetota bacterium]